MPVKQFIVDVLDTAYPAEPQIVVPFEADSVLFINVAGAPNGDGGFYTPSDVEITWDAVHQDDPVQLTVRTSGPAQSIALNVRAHRIFLRNATTGGTRMQVVCNKDK